MAKVRPFLATDNGQMLILAIGLSVAVIVFGFAPHDWPDRVSDTGFRIVIGGMLLLGLFAWISAIRRGAVGRWRQTLTTRPLVGLLGPMRILVIGGLLVAAAVIGFRRSLDLGLAPLIPVLSFLVDWLTGLARRYYEKREASSAAPASGSAAG